MVFPLLCDAAQNVSLSDRYVIPAVPLVLSVIWLLSEYFSTEDRKPSTPKPPAAASYLRTPLISAGDYEPTSSPEATVTVKSRVSLPVRQAAVFILIAYISINCVSYCGKLIAGGDDKQHEDEFSLIVFICLLASWVCILCGDSVSFKKSFKNDDRTKQPYILSLLAVLCTLVQASLVSGCHDFGASSSFSFTSSLRSWFWLYSWVVAAVCAIACFVPVATEQVPESELNAEQRCYDLHKILLFTWFSPILDIGDTKQLSPNDLPRLMLRDRADHNWAAFANILGAAQWTRPTATATSAAAAAPGAAAAAAEATSPGTLVGSSEVVGGGRGGGDALSTASATSEPAPPVIKRQLWWRLVLLTKPWFIGSGVLAFANLLASYVQIISMYIVLNNVGAGSGNNQDGDGDSGNDDDDGDDDGGARSALAGVGPTVVKAAVGGLFLGPVLAAATTVLQQHLSRRVAIKARAALVQLLYRKALRIDLAAQDAKIGEIVNLMSSDIDNILNAVGSVHYMWIPILQLVAAAVLLNTFVGPSFWAAVVFMVAVLPVYAVGFGRLQKFQMALMKRKDDRLGVITEVLSGVRIIKLCAMEKGFLAKIQDARVAELAVLRQFLYLLTVLWVVILSTPTLTGVATFVTRTAILGKTLDAATAFTTLALLDQLRSSFTLLPWVANQLIQAQVSLTRIGKFLDRTEVSRLHRASTHTAAWYNTTKAGTSLPIKLRLTAVSVGQENWNDGGGGGGVTGVGGGGDMGGGGRGGRVSDNATSVISSSLPVYSTASGEEEEEDLLSVGMMGRHDDEASLPGINNNNNNRRQSSINLSSSFQLKPPVFAKTPFLSGLDNPSSSSSSRTASAATTSTTGTAASAAAAASSAFAQMPTNRLPVKVCISNGTFRWGDGKSKKDDKAPVEGESGSGSNGGDGKVEEEKGEEAALPAEKSERNVRLAETDAEGKDCDTEQKKTLAVVDGSKGKASTTADGYAALPSLAEGTDNTKEKAEKKEQEAATGGEEVAEVEEEEVAVDALTKVNLAVEEGSLCCVYGITGGGKTSLLSALLGEMTNVSGSVSLDGSVAYTSQKAWNQNATIRSNILFNGGNDFSSPQEKIRYETAVEACSLTSDFEVLEGGDSTEIGEKGITLSGGQQQRVALARACFADADVYLLDDPLSAVDAHVGERLFHDAICGLLKEKTRVLVTHQVALTLPRADRVVVMGSGGVILEQGSPEELKRNPDSHLNDLLRTLGKQGDDGAEDGDDDEGEEGDGDKEGGSGGGGVRNGPEETKEGLEEEGGTSSMAAVSQAASSSSSNSPRVGNSPRSSKSPNGKGGGLKKMPSGEKNKKEAAAAAAAGAVGAAITTTTSSTSKGAVKLVKDEERQQGAPSWSVYKAYINACGGWPVMGFVTGMTMAVTILAYVAALEMAAWIEDMEDGGASNIKRGLYNYLAATAAWVGCMGVWILARQVASLKASNTLHGTMMETVLRAPIGWFDRTPVGRIQNRFSSDMQSVDREVMSSVMGFVYCASAPAMSLFVIFTHLPLFLVPVFLLIVFLSWRVAKRYLTTARELKRLQSVAKSPLYAHFTESLHGLPTLRAFSGAEERFIEQNLQKVDDANVAELYLWSAQRWLGFRLNCLGAVVNGTCGVYIWYSGSMNPAIAGLVLNYASDFTAYVAALITSLATMEMSMNAVERAGEFCALPQEAAAESLPGKAPPPSWPSGGAIKADHLCLRYESSTSNVIDDLSFHIPARASVGVVGRTGAGKSTLSLALLRVLEAHQGTLYIDGVDLKEVGLDELRSKVAIVPQDPMLFNGSVRFNLDPFDRYDDHVLLEALERVQLSDLWAHKLDKTLTTTTTTAEDMEEEFEEFEDKEDKKEDTIEEEGHRLKQPSLSNEEDDKNKNVSRKSRASSSGVMSSASGSGGSGSNNLLSLPINESGSNLSVGERQLLCLARALIRGNKVLVMDEATANVDPHTDERIQRVIRNELSSATVLTVAHRLGTIIYYDLVMVMGQGKILEMASPSALLSDPNSSFYAMCAKTGDLDHLIAEASTNKEQKAAAGNGAAEAAAVAEGK